MKLRFEVTRSREIAASVRKFPAGLQCKLTIELALGGEPRHRHRDRAEISVRRTLARPVEWGLSAGRKCSATVSPAAGTRSAVVEIATKSLGIAPRGAPAHAVRTRGAKPSVARHGNRHGHPPSPPNVRCNWRSDPHPVVRPSAEYEIHIQRAWIAGAPQLNSRR